VANAGDVSGAQLPVSRDSAAGQGVNAASQATPAAPTWHWFSEAGAASGRSLLCGLGIAMDVAGGQQLFAEAALQTGAGVGQSSELLIGVKSNYPAITLRSHKLTPFSIVGYGASIEAVLKSKTAPPVFGLSPAAVTGIGTSAGFAQQYAAGAALPIHGWNVGLGVSSDKLASGWKAYPFVFLSHAFGKLAK
jgi:hypothetical protein